MHTGVKAPHTMGSQQTGNGARRRANALTAHQNSPLPHCPMTAQPLPLWHSCQMNQAWSTLPLTPAWRTTVSQAAQPALLLAAAPRRVSVSGRMDVCVWSGLVLHEIRESQKPDSDSNIRLHLQSQNEKTSCLFNLKYSLCSA